MRRGHLITLTFPLTTTQKCLALKYNVRQHTVNVLSSTQISFEVPPETAHKPTKKVRTADIRFVGLMYTAWPPCPFLFYGKVCSYSQQESLTNKVKRDIKSFNNIKNKYTKNRLLMDSQENITLYSYDCFFLCISLIHFSHFLKIFRHQSYKIYQFFK